MAHTTKSIPQIHQSVTVTEEEKKMDLRREVERLTHDLQQACQEKVQAAEYGLAVLEEKQELQDKLDELESKYDTTKHDLKQAKEVSYSYKCLHNACLFLFNFFFCFFLCVEVHQV